MQNGECCDATTSAEDRAPRLTSSKQGLPRFLPGAAAGFGNDTSRSSGRSGFPGRTTPGTNLPVAAHAGFRKVLSTAGTGSRGEVVSSSLQGRTGGRSGNTLWTRCARHAHALHDHGSTTRQQADGSARQPLDGRPRRFDLFRPPSRHIRAPQRATPPRSTGGCQRSKNSQKGRRIEVGGKLLRGLMLAYLEQKLPAGRRERGHALLAQPRADGTRRRSQHAIDRHPPNRKPEAHFE